MNNYFINITKHLNLNLYTASNTIVSQEINSNKFKLTEVTEESVKNEVLKLNTKKSSTSSSIPATILKQSFKLIYLF